MKKQLTVTAGAAIAAALLFTGCSAPSGPAGYGSLGDLHGAYVKAGGDCAPWEVGDSDGPWKAYGNCGEYNEQGEAVLAIYPSKKARDKVVSGMKSSGGSVSLGQVLVGSNWSIEADALGGIKKKLGGTIVSLRPESVDDIKTIDDAVNFANSLTTKVKNASNKTLNTARWISRFADKNLPSAIAADVKLKALRIQLDLLKADDDVAVATQIITLRDLAKDVRLVAQ